MKDLRTIRLGDSSDSTPIDMLGRTGRWYFDSSRLTLDHINVRAAFESAPVALALCDLAGDVLCANHLFIVWMELESPASIVGRNLARTCQVLNLSTFMDRLPETDEVCDIEMNLASESKTDRPRRMLCKGQRIAGADLLPRWLVLSLVPLPDRNLQVEWISQALADAEKKSGIAHWCMPCQPDEDPRNNEMFWSGGAEKTLGAPTVRRCADWLACIIPEDRFRVQQCLQLLIERGTPYCLEYRLLGRNGMPGRMVQSRGWRLNQTDVSGHMLVGADQLLVAELAADEAWQQMITMGRSLFDASDWPVGMIDMFLRVKYANHGFRTCLCDRQSNDDLTGLPLQQVISDATVRRQLVTNVRHGLRGQQRAEVMQVSSDGLVREFDVNLLPLRSAHQELLGVLVIAVMVKRG